MKNSATELIAPAKVNTYLKIVGKRDDGYHELDTLFIPFDALYDTLIVTKATEGFDITCKEFDIPVTDNLIYKAWDKYAKLTSFRPALHVELIKRTPTGAGLGGGSSDCAAILKYLNNINEKNKLDDAQMNKLAASLGADVPFFLLDGPAWAKGIGEILSPCTVDMKGLIGVLACPNVHVNTVWAYKAWSKRKKTDEIKNNQNFFLTTSPSPHNKTDSKATAALENDFEKVVFPEFPVVKETKDLLINNGAIGAVMSGSGASVISFFSEKKLALNATNELNKLGIKSVINCF